MMRRLALGIALCAVETAAMAQTNQPWVEVRGPHFTLVTDAGEPSGRRVARELELIRVAFQQAFAASRVDPIQEILVYALEDESGLAELLPEIWEDPRRAKPAGLFRRGPIRHHMALRLDINSERPYDTIYHEYFHVLAEAALGEIPLWLNEGMASYWQATQIFSGEMRVGGANLGHISALRREAMMPLSRLFAVGHDSPEYQDADKASMFYAQSWALVHYLMVGDRRGREKIAGYLQRLRSGDDPVASIGVAFGDIAALESQLVAYVRRSDFRASRQQRPPPIPDDVFAARELSEAETLSLKGEFLARGNPAQGRDTILAAIELEPELALAHETLAFVLIEARELPEAMSSMARAVELGTRNYLTHFYYAGLALETRAPIDKVLSSLEAATGLNPEFAPAHLLFAELSSEWGTRLDAGLESAKRAVDLAPREPMARLALARVRTARGEPDEAAQSYQAAIALGLRSPTVFYDLGMSLAEAGEPAAASDALTEAIESAPPGARLHEWYAALALQLLAVDRFEDSLGAFEQSVAADGTDDAEILSGMARALAGVGREQEALDLFEKSKIADPYSGRVAFDYATALSQMERNADALAELERAIELEPDVGRFHDAMAKALQLSGDHEKARYHREQAERLGYRP